MARPLRNTFEQDSPMTPQSAAGISYQTNVNRQKTKKWTEAKAVDYGGDDWGDDDEYHAPSPPISKPTGFRQQGQGLQSSVRPEPPAFDKSKKYGELPPLPPASDPQDRRNSFDADDERRNFSNATIRQPSPAAATPTSGGPATRFSQITGLPSTRTVSGSGPPALSIQTQQPQAPTGIRKPSQIVSPVSESPHPEILKPGKTNTGESTVTSPTINTPSTASDFHARRDYSPSAVPLPLSSRAPASPQPPAEPSPAKFPARKSSLSQSTRPTLSEITIPARPSLVESKPKPWISGQAASPSSTAKSPAPATGKALPFIRPADIYRRAEERRQSLDSSRPSMDSINAPKTSDPSESPAVPQLRERLSSDSLGGSGQRRTSFQGDDGSESGRCLMPMLEPVKERKSEYGFEGVNVNDPTLQPESIPDLRSGPSMDSEEVDEEEPRRLSTSPKLPDLTRMSGFGIDMFSEPKPKAPEPVKSEVEENASTATSPPTEDLSLRSQPSFGFRSVVNQAFDRVDDNSVPPTPASIDGSGVGRTDSQSTGTTGISPIMSRIPSGASESRNREMANPSILEVVNEPESSRTFNDAGNLDAQRGREIPGFKPGYRRAISTPRTENSPARMPDLAKSKVLTSGQHAVVSEHSLEDSSTEQESLQPSRPNADREASFRPAIPGGWISYATTAQNEDQSQASSTRSATPVRESTAAGEIGDDDVNFTPSTTKHVVPLSKSSAASELTTPKETSMAGDNFLPTPDPAMAPSGNLHSTTNLDPRLLPKPEQAPNKTQLRSDAISTDSPVQNERNHLPRHKDVAENDVANYISEPVTQPMPSVQTQSQAPAEFQSPGSDAYPIDDEHDRLEQEIVKSLTSRPSEGGVEEGVLSEDFEEGNYPKQGHESTYLPSEYDNYWNSTLDDEGNITEPIIPSVEDPVKKPEVSQIQTAARDDHLHAESPVIPPLSPYRPQQPTLEPPRPALESRFSWEKSSERVNLTKNDEVSSVSAASSPVRPSQPSEDVCLPPTTASSEAVHTDRKSAATEAQMPESQAGHETKAEPHNTNMLLAEAGAASLTAVALPAYNLDRQEPKSRRLSLAEEKDPRVTSHPVSPTPPEDQHPARAAQSYFTQNSNQNSPIPAPSTVSPMNSPAPEQQNMPPVGPLGPFPKFSEIATLRTPQERIHELDSTRQRFALMNSGLNEWLATIRTQHPEHADAGPFYAGTRTSVPTGTGRSKFGKAISSAPAPLQPPYYQQYLNASSPTNPSSPIGPRPGPASGMASGSQQGFSSNSGKLTSHQVQAKGKELLHTAGIFGGKAGKAGKGLLAKGKSRFRVGGDKDSQPPKPKNEQPKQDRRSSWGLPLSLTRSSGHSHNQSQQSKEPIPPSERSRAATTSSTRSATAPPQLPDLPTGNSLMGGDLPSMHADLGIQRQEPLSIKQYQQSESNAENSEARDSLGVPAPIGEHQPNWDSHNAAPIAEEDVFQYDDRPTERHFSTDVAGRPGSLTVPLNNKSTSERLNSDDAHFYSTQEEETANLNDWVMVSPNQETKTPLSLPNPANDRKPNVMSVSSTGVPTQDLDQMPARVSNDQRRSMDAPMKSPVTSILNRPRGSSYSIPSLASSAEGTAPKAVEPMEVVSSLPGLSSSRANPVSTEPEKQSRSSSLLPPIRRTSTFGLGFGPRQAKPRFPLEDEDEQRIPVAVAEPVPVVEPSPVKVMPNPIPASNEPVIETAPVESPVLDIPEPQNLDILPVSPIETPEEAVTQEHQSAPVSNQAPRGVRPLSFQTSGAAEVLTTPFKSAEGESNAAPVEASDPGPPKYFEQPLSARKAYNQPEKQESNELHPASNAQPAPLLQQRPNLVQPTSSEYNDQLPIGYQQTALPQPFMQPKKSPSRLPENLPALPNDRQGIPPVHARHASKNSQLPPLITPRAADVLQRPEFRESQVEWRPNRPKAADPPPPVVSPSYWKDVDAPAPRSSLEQRQRGWSGSSPSYSGRPDGQYSDRTWVGSPVQQNPYPQPPSSAQRYPELFRPGQAGGEAQDSVDLPAHHYQAPITRAQAFLPRQQTNEYQIAGVGPPTNDPRNGTTRRNSSFLKEIGGKLSRASSRDRGNAQPRGSEPPSPSGRSQSRGHDYADSIVTTGTDQEPRRRRSSFFGNLGRNSTSGLDPPQSRESVIAHNSASRSDLLASSQPSPVHQERKRSFFGSSSKDPKPKPNKLVRSSTGNVEPAIKKNRFSGLSGMFSKSGRESVQERPQAARKVSYNEHQQSNSPQLDRNGAVAIISTPPPSQSTTNQSKKVLHKLSSSTPPRPSPGTEGKTRRSSSGGLLSNFMGRKSAQLERGSDESRSQGSSQPRTTPQVLPAAQTYSDLQGEEMAQATPQFQHRREIPFQDPTIRVADRGRQATREPQYDSVPIPGGYSLVRGQGALPVAAEYDARGMNRTQQVDPRYSQQAGSNLDRNGLPTHTPVQYRNDGRNGSGSRPHQSPAPIQKQRDLLQPNPRFGALETYGNYTARATPRKISREDLLARSPPLPLEGQQRPYPILLPGDDDEEERPVPLPKDNFLMGSYKNRTRHDAIQRLQQPTLRHPESPAGYPLPEDTVFSPINPKVNDIPAPPPPQWPGRMDPQPSLSPHSYHERQPSLSTMDGTLDRSNTHRTAISVVSGLSGPQSGGLNVPTRQISDATETDHDRRHLSSPSPSPPSPMPGTPVRNVGHQLHHENSQNNLRHDMRTTELTAQRSREDLYNASPKLPKPTQLPREQLTQSSIPSNTANTSNYNANHHHSQANGKDNINVGRSDSVTVPHMESIFQPESQFARGSQPSAQEEKIVVRDGIAGRAELPVASDDDGPPEMSAVSYPGMEWNPYAAGAWDDGYD